MEGAVDWDSSPETDVRKVTVTGMSLLGAVYLFYSFYLVMSGGLKEVERHLASMTAGDLTTTPRPWGRDEAARLMGSLSAMQSSLRNIVSEVRGASTGLVLASEEIASASNDLSARSELAAANLEESASAMHEIAATVSNTADTSGKAANIAQSNASSAEASGRTVQQLVETMQGVEQSSQRIADIIGVIDGIAFQTNILALNAAVEAARAGEQGKGFAVVASEVRALAHRSSAAAKEIGALIRDSSDKVKAGAEVVHVAGQNIGELVHTAGRMSTLMAEVLAGTREQSAGVSVVSGSIQTLDQQTQQNAALVEQTAAAATALRDQAKALAGQVSRFVLPA